MNVAEVEKVANALLYEGYLLYPYAPDSTKNRQRWNFGTLFPGGYVGVVGSSEACGFHAEFLVTNRANAADACIEVRLRFLHFAHSQANSEAVSWNHGAERRIDLGPVSLQHLQERRVEIPFHIDPQKLPHQHSNLQIFEEVGGLLTLHALLVESNTFRISLDVANTSELPQITEREDALLYALISAHALVRVSGAELVSLLEPSPDLAQANTQCRNAGVFPVMVGSPGQRDTMLISPIILYDYPQVAPESSGDFFDSTEMDEMLALRVLTLTDEEKEQVRNGDPRGRDILERTCGLGEDQLRKLHGAVRSLRRGGGHE